MKIFSVFLAAALSAACAWAAEAAGGDDLESGRRLGNFCSSCHGPQGSGPGQTIPYIGGQSAEYLANTMIEMRDKRRAATLMQKISQGYSDGDIEKIALYYSKQPWRSNNNKIDAKLAKQGKALSESCEGCHGEAGLSDGYTPRIGGFPAEYIYYALLEYKNGLRNMEEGGASMGLVSDMDEKEFKALAEYYSSLK